MSDFGDFEHHQNSLDLLEMYLLPRDLGDVKQNGTSQPFW